MPDERRAWKALKSISLEVTGLSIYSTVAILSRNFSRSMSLLSDSGRLSAMTAKDISLAKA